MENLVEGKNPVLELLKSGRPVNRMMISKEISQDDTVQEIFSQIKQKRIPYERTVKKVLDRYPQALQVFLDLGLLCVGCPAETFHTLADVAREYNLDLNQLLQRIYKAIGDDEVLLVLSSQKNDGQSDM